MDGYNFDGYDDYSTYNGDSVHDSWVDDMYNAGVGSAFVGLNDCSDDEPIIDRSSISPHLRKYIDDYGNIDADSLLNDCLRDVGYYDD